MLGGCPGISEGIFPQFLLLATGDGVYVLCYENWLLRIRTFSGFMSQAFTCVVEFAYGCRH